jgi:serine/threonine protein phosphatase PrpC
MINVSVTRVRRELLDSIWSGRLPHAQRHVPPNLSSMSLEVRFWAATDVGLTRDHNEDNFLVDKKLNLFIVADGMGGHAAGEVASSIAVREVRRMIAEKRDVVEAFLAEDTPEGRKAVLELIDAAIVGACGRVYRMAQENPERRGMGTTLSMLLIGGRRGFIGHVGDSRIYLSRADQVHQLTEDHSLINELIKRGRLKPGDAFDSPYKNAVTRAVGVYESVEVDTFDFDVLPDDNYLLCSDGLSCYIDDPITAEYLSDENVKAVPERFIQLANECGGKDNITAVVVRMVEAVEDDQRKRAAEVRQRLDTLRTVPLFRYLTYRGLVKIQNIAELRTVDAKASVYREGTRGDAMYIVLSGRVQLRSQGVVLAEVGAGGHFGELALVDKSPRAATALAVEEARLLVISRARLFDTMQSDQQLSMKLMWSFMQSVLVRLHLTQGELLTAWSGFDRLRADPKALVDMPSPNPVIAGLCAIPVAVTDELVPGFLFTDPDSEVTNPLVRVEAGPSPAGDLDQRPGLASVEVEPSEPAQAVAVEVDKPRVTLMDPVSQASDDEPAP